MNRTLISSTTLVGLAALAAITVWPFGAGGATDPLEPPRGNVAPAGASLSTIDLNLDRLLGVDGPPFDEALIRIDSVPGTSSLFGYNAYIEIDSVRFSLSRSVSTTGGGVGPVGVDELTVRGSSPDYLAFVSLMEAQADTSTTPFVTILLLDQGMGSLEELVEIQLDQARISGVEATPDGGFIARITPINDVLLRARSSNGGPQLPPFEDGCVNVQTGNPC